jgi:hypothetical protein
LIAYQRATRRKGGSTLEDLPRSTLRYLSGKLTFVPAGGAKPDKKIVDRQAASPSSWKTPFMAAWM